MIEARDLRIGGLFRVTNRSNAVHIPGIKVIKLYKIGIFECLVCDHDQNFAQVSEMLKVDTSDLSPIPLTEEILIKAGFVSTRNGYWNNGKIDIGYTTTDEWFEYEYLSATSARTEMTAIKYVHQLQNLVHILTGTELILTL